MLKMLISGEKSDEELFEIINNGITFEENSNFQQFNQDLRKFVMFHIEKITCKNQFDDEYLIEFLCLFCEIIHKAQGYFISSYQRKMFEFVYVNIGEIFSLLSKRNIDCYDILLLRPWEIYITTKEKMEDVNKVEKQLAYMSGIFEQVKNYVREDLRGNLYTVFCDSFLRNVIDKAFAIFAKSKFNFANFFSFLIFFLPYYDQIRKVYNIFFKGDKLLSLNKEGIFLTKLLRHIHTHFPNPTSIDESIIYIKDKLFSSDYSIILHLMSLLVCDEINLKLFTQILIGSIKSNLLETFFKKKENQELDVLGLFNKIKMFENKFFNESIRNFFNLPDIIPQYKKMVSEVLNTTNQISEIFCQAFDNMIRAKEINEVQLESIFSYFDILYDYDRFEEVYIYNIVSRAIDEVFDLIKEKELITMIEKKKEKVSYSYKLQTVINNIKIARSSVMNLIILPYHSYHLINFGCKPVISESMRNLLNTQIALSEFPKNSNLIFQQGYVEFTSKLFPDVIFLGDSIEYCVLNYIYPQIRALNEIETKFELSQDFAEYLFEIFLSNSLVVKSDGNKYALDIKSIPLKAAKEGKSIKISLCWNLKDFLENKKSEVKMSDKHINTIIDCHIMRHLKKEKKGKLKSITNEIIHILPSFQDLSEGKIKSRLEDLAIKGLINNIGDNYFYL